MDTEKRQSLVKRHEQIDARVWNQFFGAWWPLAPWSELSVTYRADLGVDQGTVTVPYSHPCASIFRQVRDGVPAPISIEINGVFISGQITTAQAERAEETQAWHLTVQTDAKHAHSMMARPLVQSAADSAETQLRGELGVVARQLIGLASSRTGLPAYVCVDAPGDPVDLVARTEDTVADVLSHAVSGSDLFVDVRMLLPGQDLPGENIIERFAGSVERQWENAALDAGLWPHAETDERLIDVVEGPNGVVPPFSWRGVASVNHVGELLDEPTEGYVWLPFATQAPYIGSEYYEPDRPMLDGSRVITAAALDSHAEKFPGWASFVTEWKSGAVFSELQENERLHEAAKVGLLKLPDGTKLPASWAELGPLLHDYLGWDDRNFTTPGVFAWRDGASWVISNAADIVEEKAKRAANLVQKQTPGVLFHFYPERDRRGIIFSSVPGGGLKEWSATYTAPDAAMLIAAAQLDEWTMQQMGLGTLPEQAVTGEQSATSVDASTMKNIPATVDQIDVDVQPQARLEGSDVAYHAAGGRVDIGKAGPFFYREKYLNLGNSGTVNPVQQMSQEWSRAQGSTTVQLTPSERGGAVFGDDIVGDDGRRIPGWRHGDRVSFVDGDTRISEIIVGWTLTANAGETLEISPILGREDNGVLAQLGERIRGAERTSKKTALSPPRRIPAKEIENRAEDVFVREGSAWSEIIRETVEEGRQHVIDAEGHADDARANAEAAFGEAERAVGLVSDANVIIDQAQEKLDTIPEIIESGRWWAQLSATQSASSRRFASQALIHADKADEHAQSALRLVNDALVLVDAADSALDLVEVELAKIPGLIAEGEQHVANAARHAQNARRNAASSQGLAAAAINLVADANLILDAANVEMGKIPGIIAQGEQHVTDAGNHAQDARDNAAAAFAHLEDVDDLLTEARALDTVIRSNAERVQGHLSRASGFASMSTAQAAQSLAHADEARRQVSIAQSWNVVIEAHVDAARIAVDEGAVHVVSALEAVEAAQGLVNDADVILGDVRDLHGTIQPMINQGQGHVASAKNHADRADQAVTDAGLAKTAAETALTNATNLLADIDGEGTDFPTAVTQVLGAHNDVLTKHSEVLDAHGEAITAASAASRDAGTAAGKALEATGALTVTQALHTEVLTKHGEVLTKHGEAITSATNAAASAVSASESLADAVTAMQAANSARDTAITEASNAAESAGAAVITLGEAVEEVTKAQGILTANQLIQTDVNAKHAGAIQAAGDAANFATKTALDATKTAESAAAAASSALDAVGTLTTVQTLHTEVLTKHGEAIVAATGAAESAAAAAADATETAESASEAADKALEAAETLGLIQLEMIEVDRLQNLAIEAAADAAADAAMAAIQAAATGRLAAQAADEAGRAAYSAGKAADDALDAAEALADVQADALEVQRLHGEAIVAVAGAAESAAAAAADATETAESAASAADAALDAIEAMEGAFDEWEKAELERESAWEAHQAVVEQNSLNIDQLEKQLVGMRQELERVRGNQWTPVTIGPNGSIDDFTTDSNSVRVRLRVAGTWTGRIVATIAYEVGPINGKYDVQSQYTWDVGVTREFTVSHVSAWTPKFIRLDYQRDAAQVRQSNGTLRNHATSRNAWTVLRSLSVPKAAEGIASVRVGWHSATNGDEYGVRIRVGGTATSGGTVVANDGPRTGLGPLTFLGNGYRVQTASNQSFQVPAGAVIRLESWATGSTATRREIRDATLNIAWIDRG